MNYRNRGPRCPHGMLIGVISCPGCVPPDRTRGPHGERYIRSEVTHHVINKRVPGRPSYRNYGGKL